MTIPCIHEGEKTKMTIKYQGVKKEVFACSACVSIINESSLCEVVS